MKEKLKDKMDRQILRIIREKKPDNVEQLIKSVQETHSLPEKNILDRILHLQETEAIRLDPRQKPPQRDIANYLWSSQAYWYWITVVLASTTSLVIFTVPENAFPLVYLRYLLGSIFILWLPGYTFIKALFPRKELDSIERSAFSIGMSLALVPIIGLILNYTPWGIRPTPITISLLALTVAFATAAILREHQTENERKAD